jgi:hypothetical protein
MHAIDYIAVNFKKFALRKCFGHRGRASTKSPRT